ISWPMEIRTAAYVRIGLWRSEVGPAEAGGGRRAEGLVSTHCGGSPAVRPVPPESVESRCGAVVVGRTYLLPPLSSGGASLVRPWPRFHTPLIEPDMQISRTKCGAPHLMRNVAPAEMWR